MSYVSVSIDIRWRGCGSTFWRFDSRREYSSRTSCSRGVQGGEACFAGAEGGSVMLSDDGL